MKIGRDQGIMIFVPFGTSKEWFDHIVNNQLFAFECWRPIGTHLDMRFLRKAVLTLDCPDNFNYAGCKMRCQLFRFDFIPLWKIPNSNIPFAPEWSGLLPRTLNRFAHCESFLLHSFLLCKLSSLFFCKLFWFRWFWHGIYWKTQETICCQISSYLR